MYLVPLSQLESVELLVHSLKAAAGEADCTMCPAYRVCMKQCLTIARSVEQMLEQGSLPQLGENSSGPEGREEDARPSAPELPPKGGLRVVK